MKKDENTQKADDTATPSPEEQIQQHIEELTADLQRTRADFENYRKRIDAEKIAMKEAGAMNATLKLLPVIDTIERAAAHVPDDLKENKWAQGVVGLVKSLEKSLEAMNIKRIEAKPGAVFNPDLHEAIQFDEDATGETEIIEEELQAGYLYQGKPLRHAMVKVTRK